MRQTVKTLWENKIERGIDEGKLIQVYKDDFKCYRESLKGEDYLKRLPHSRNCREGGKLNRAEE